MPKLLLSVALLGLATCVATVAVSLARTGTFVMDRVEVPGGREAPSAYFPVAGAAFVLAVSALVAAFAMQRRPRR